MGVTADRGGDDAGLVELAIVAEEIGRHAAPVPLVETMVAARLLAAVDGDAARAPRSSASSPARSRRSPSPARTSGPQLVPGGAVAPIVVGLRDDALVLLADGHRAGTGGQPGVRAVGVARPRRRRRDPDRHAARAAFAAAKDEWRILTAAALVGLGDAAEGLGVQYAKDRHAFGAAIGSFQAIAHPLVDAAIGIEGARRLVYRAAWFADHEPEALGARASTAFVHAAEAAERAGAVAIHTQGGFGFTLESDVQLFYRRAKGWALVGGDRRGELRRVAEHLVGASASDDGARS